MSPVATKEEAMELMGQGSFEIRGMRLAKTMTLADVKSLYKLWDSGEAFLTPAEWRAILIVVVREFEGKDMPDAIQKIGSQAKNQIFGMNLAYGAKHPDKSLGWSNLAEPEA